MEITWRLSMGRSRGRMGKWYRDEETIGRNKVDRRMLRIA